jgi:hypothetical protein
VIDGESDSFDERILRPDQFISKALRKSKHTACERLVRMTRAAWLDCGENAIGRIVPE